MTRTFPLAVLLALREQREQVEERSLAKTNAELSELRQVLRRLGDEITRQADSRVGHVNTVLLAADYLSFEARRNELRSAETELLEKLKVLEAKGSAQLQNYLRARCDRETLTEVRNQHRKEWEAHEKMRDQKAVGDLFNARRKRK